MKTKQSHPSVINGLNVYALYNCTSHERWKHHILYVRLYMYQTQIVSYPSPWNTFEVKKYVATIIWIDRRQTVSLLLFVWERIAVDNY